MGYAVADIALFILLLCGLWLLLYGAVRWVARRREQAENAELIKSLENDLNKNLKKRDGGS